MRPIRSLSRLSYSSVSLRLACAPTAVALAALPATAQEKLWLEQFGSLGTDKVTALVSDGVGGVYAGGRTGGDLGGASAGELDAWVARYDGAGGQLWIRQIGSSSYDYAQEAAPDASGGLYLLGTTSGALGGPSFGSYDAWLARYDSAGNQLWILQIGSSSLDGGLAASPDGAGGVFVGGPTWGDLGATNAGAKDFWLARYSATGSQLWVRQSGTTATETLTSASPDLAGGVFVCGTTRGDLSGPNLGQYDVWLARYDGAGNQHWVVQFGTAGEEGAAGCAPDGAGGVYVTGDTSMSLGGPTAGGFDAWVARYDAAGTQLWIRQLGTTAADRALTAAEDGSGGVYIAGRTTGSLGGPSAGDIDSWMAHYDSQGNKLWVLQLGTSLKDYIWSSAPDGAGGLYAGGDTGGELGAPVVGQQDAWFARIAGSCGPGSTYCVASATSIPGCQAAIAGSGTPSFANPTGFTLSSGSVPGGNVGICFFGNHGEAAIPFGTLGGQICAAPPVFRCGSKTGGGTPGACDGQFVYTLQDLITASPANVFAGAILNAQIWARDPANPDGFLLSDGLEFTVCP